MPRLWIALDIKRVDGPTVHADEIPQWFEDDVLPDSEYFDSTELSIEVLGIGRNVKEVEESIKQRRANAKGMSS